MKKVNPVVIPRNHNVEKALANADADNFSTINELLLVLKDPYNSKNNISKFQNPGPSSSNKYVTFCGT